MTDLVEQLERELVRAKAHGLPASYIQALELTISKLEKKWTS